MIPQSYYDYTRSRESGGNTSAKNPRSSATGLYQFTSPTWNDVMQQHPDLGLTPDGRTDPAQSESAMRAFTEDNAARLAKAGYDPSTSNLYLAHRFGAGGALKALSASPDAYVSDVFPEVMSANPDLKGKRIADITAGNKSMPDPMSLSPYGTNTVIAPQRQPLPGALSADGVTGGEGILGRVMSPEGLTGIERAGVYLSGIGDPRALSALSNIGPKAGRFTQTVDNQRGVIRIIDSQTGKVTETPIPGFDKNFEANKAYDAKQAEGFSEKNNAIVSAAQSAAQHMATLDQLGGILAAKDENGAYKVYQGAQGENVQALRKLGVQLGLSSADVAKDGDIAQSLSNQLTLQMKNAADGKTLMPGAMSDSDRNFLAKASTSLNNQPEANAQVIANARAVHQRALDIESLRQQYVKEHGRLDEGFNTVVSNFANANPMFSGQSAAAAPSVAPASSAPALPKGVKSIQLVQ